MPRISCARLPVGTYQVDAGALAAPTPRPAGQAIWLLMASAAGKSVLPAGKPLLLRTCATRSAACWSVSEGLAATLAALPAAAGAGPAPAAGAAAGAGATGTGGIA